jgi:CheY-like chemotaxis protein
VYIEPCHSFAHSKFAYCFFPLKFDIVLIDLCLAPQNAPFATLNEPWHVCSKRVGFAFFLDGKAQFDSAHAPNIDTARSRTTHMKHIVCIEDDPDVLDFLTLLLNDNEYQVHPVLCSMEGVETIRQTQSDLVLLDLMMPGKSGWDIMREMRSDPKLTRVPVLIVSACKEKVSRLLDPAFDTAIVGYVEKPFSPFEIRGQVETILNQKFHHTNQPNRLQSLTT